MLWAFGQAHHGDPRLVSWPETQRQVSRLLPHYGRGAESDRVYYPVAALYRTALWELAADPKQVPSAHGSTIPQRWFSDH